MDAGGEGGAVAARERTGAACTKSNHNNIGQTPATLVHRGSSELRAPHGPRQSVCNPGPGSGRGEHGVAVSGRAEVGAAHLQDDGVVVCLLRHFIVPPLR